MTDLGDDGIKVVKDAAKRAASGIASNLEPLESRAEKARDVVAAMGSSHDEKAQSLEIPHAPMSR